MTTEASGGGLRGVICALLTPMNPDGSLDESSTRSLLDFVMDGGVHAVMPGGTTGEGFLLSLEDRQKLLEVVTEHLDGRVPVIAHVGCMNTDQTVELTRHARDAGVAAITAIAPYFYTFDETSVENHFSALAEAVPGTDVYAYTFPDNAKNDVPPDMMSRLTDAYPNIRGIKISNSDLLNLRAHVKAGAGSYGAYCGSDSVMLAALLEGAVGQVSGNANVAPRLMRGLFDAHSESNYVLAAEHQGAIDDLRTGTADGLHPAFYKSLLVDLGVIKSATVRRPLRQPDDGERTKLKRVLESLKAREQTVASS